MPGPRIPVVITQSEKDQGDFGESQKDLQDPSQGGASRTCPLLGPPRAPCGPRLGLLDQRWVNEGKKNPLEQLSVQLEALFPQEIPCDFLVMGDVSKLGEGSAMTPVIWTKSSDSERGQVWDYPDSLPATHPER